MSQIGNAIIRSARWTNKKYGKKAFAQGKRVMTKKPFGFKAGKNVGKNIRPRTKKGYSKKGGQWGSSHSTINFNTLSKVNTMNQLIKASKTKTIYRFNAVKDFDNNGYWFFSNKYDGTVNSNIWLPCFTYDLTSVINGNIGSSNVIQSMPLSQASMDGFGDVYFYPRHGVKADGSTADYNLQLEQSAYGNQLSGTTQSEPQIFPNSKDILKWASVKLNLWGCKNRATKFKLMIVRVKDDTIAPTHLQVPNGIRTEFFQNMLKPLVYNPISTINNNFKKYVDILKTENFYISDTSSTSTDQDPQVITKKLFLRLNRLCDYTRTGSKLGNQLDFANQSDYTVQTGIQNDAYLKPTHRLYLMLVASNYGLDTSETNADTPSFDIVVRTCHESLS